MRIKICGLTREEDVDAAVAAGADAIGFVFYPPSPRYVSPQGLQNWPSAYRPLVTLVGLFVNETPEIVQATCAAVPINVLQFHGDEDAAYCRQFFPPLSAGCTGKAGARSVRIRPLVSRCTGLLLDAFVDGYGGGGHVFDWTLIPKTYFGFLVLSGGLTVTNVADAIERVRPVAVDVSSVSK